MLSCLVFLVLVCVQWCTTILCCVFLFCFVLFCLSSSCVPYVASFSGLSIFDGPFGILWIVHFRWALRYSLDCPFQMGPSLFSGLSILDGPFGILWIVHFRWALRYSLDCPFQMGPLVFSNVYLLSSPCKVMAHYIYDRWCNG